MKSGDSVNILHGELWKTLVYKPGDEQDAPSSCQPYCIACGNPGESDLKFSPETRSKDPNDS